MKRQNTLTKLLTAFAVFAVGASVIVHRNVSPTRVEAAQHTDNFNLYTYSGNYYSSINFNASQGLDGQLRQDLTTLIYPKGWYTYGSSGTDHLSTQLQYADEDPTNSANMIYLYTRDSVKKNAASSWNREHVWPQSLSNGCWGESKAGTDILHIRPTYNSTNSSRSNDIYADVNKASPRTYNGMTFGYGSGAKFEPLDSVKGDVARIVMYIWVAYYNYYSNLPAITNVFESYDTLLRWHTQDKPDVLEGNRNNYSQTSDQKNRNPFVDHPELAWKIFGNSASSSVKSACMAAYPADGSSTSTDPTDLSLNRNSLTLAVDQTSQLSATISPSGASGTITWSSSNSSVATVNSTGKVTAVSAGTATIIARVSNTIYDTCTVTVTSSCGSSTEYQSVGSLNYNQDTTVNINNQLSASSDPKITYKSTSGVSIVVRKNTSTSDVNVWKSSYASCRWYVGHKVTISSANAFNKVELTCDEGYREYKAKSEGTTITNLENAGITVEYSGEKIVLTFNSLVNAFDVVGDKQIRPSFVELFSDDNATPIEPTAAEIISNKQTHSTLSYSFAKSETVAAVSDTLNKAFTGISGSSYTDWSNKKGTSGAVYAGNSYAGSTIIQLRTSSNSGIVTTTSGGSASEVSIVWGSSTQNTRILDIYGKNEPYSDVSDLFSTSTQGTLIGSIAKNGSATSVQIPENSYKYIGIRSNDGALYLETVTISWVTTTTKLTYTNVAIRFGGSIDPELWDELDNGDSAIAGYGVAFEKASVLTGLLKNSISNVEEARGFYKPVTEKPHPDLVNGNYLWNLYLRISTSNNDEYTEDYLDDDLIAAAYIKLEDGTVIFLQETTTSVKKLAQGLVSQYEDADIKESLSYLANL